MNDLVEFIKFAYKRGHKITVKSGADLVDEASCSCGWKSNPYYDGREYAIAEWVKHAKEVLS